MNIPFAELDQKISWGIASVGPAYMAACLRQHGHKVDLLRIPLDNPFGEVFEDIHSLSPNLLAISLTSRQWLRAKEMVPQLKRVIDIPVIVGGLHPTFASEFILNSPGFDYVCIGEGEQAMVEFVDSLERGQPIAGTKNIRVKDGPIPQLRSPFESIDDLPFMARDMLDEKYGVVHISTQRGCPYSCTYCAAHAIADLYEGYSNYGRRRSSENVIAELAEIKCNGEMNYVVFLDDTFTINHKWVKEFCRIYAQQFHIPFSINARAETINQQLLHVLANAGCKHIIYGVESGSARIRKEVLKRRISNDRLIEVFRWTRDAGIMVTANYIC